MELYNTNVNVFLLSFEGEKKLVAKNIDLDYLNIRSWRALFLPLLTKENRFSRIVIQPIDNRPLYERNILFTSEDNKK